MPKKILIVDDELDIVKVVAMRLEKLGYGVISAMNGKEALDITRKEKPDLIFLDVHLPVMDGYELCGILKNDVELKLVPVVFLTASSAPTVAGRMEESKADDYIIKPFEAQELLAKIRKFLG